MSPRGYRSDEQPEEIEAMVDTGLDMTDAKSLAALSEANIRNFAPVARIMKLALPENAKIAKEAKECMQECVSEFISFITSEGK
jgi:histone H3/H4